MKYCIIAIVTFVCLLTWGCSSEHAKESAVSNTPVQSEKNDLSDLRGLQMNKWVDVAVDRSFLEKLQDGEKEGHRPSLLQPSMVVSDFLLQNDDLKKLNIKSPALSPLSDDGVITVNTGKNYTLKLHLIQPIQKGTGGIWVVDRYYVSGK